MESPEELERKAAKLARELADTQAELRRVRLSPDEEAEVLAQARRRRFRLLKGGAVIAALPWIWRRKPEVATVAAMSALVGILLIGPPGSGDGSEPFAQGEAPAVMPAPTLPVMKPAVIVEIAIEPEPEKLAAEESSGVPVAPSIPPEQPPLLAVEVVPIAESPVPVPVAEEPELMDEPADEGGGEEEEPEPEPEPPPGERPKDEEDDSCLDLDLRPVVDLGICIRELLGLSTNHEPGLLGMSEFLKFRRQQERGTRLTVVDLGP